MPFHTQHLNLAVYHTNDAGPAKASESIVVPSTGAPTADNFFTKFFGGGNSTLAIIMCILVGIALIAGLVLIFLYFHTKKTKHTKGLGISGIICLAFAFGLFIPSLATFVSAAVADTSEVNANVGATSEGRLTTITTNLTVGTECLGNFRVALSTDQEGTLTGKNTNVKIRPLEADSFAEEITNNTYGVKMQDGMYRAVSNNMDIATIVYSTNTNLVQGTLIPITYAVKLDTTVPEDTYSGNIYVNDYCQAR